MIKRTNASILGISRRNPFKPLFADNDVMITKMRRTRVSVIIVPPIDISTGNVFVSRRRETIGNEIMV